MARISYVNPADVTDPEIREWMETSIRTGWPGPEQLHIRAHSPILIRNNMEYRWAMRNEGILDKDLLELVRVRVATTWERMFETGCHF